MGHRLYVVACKATTYLNPQARAWGPQRLLEIRTAERGRHSACACDSRETAGTELWDSRATRRVEKAKPALGVRECLIVKVMIEYDVGGGQVVEFAIIDWWAPILLCKAE